MSNDTHAASQAQPTKRPEARRPASTDERTAPAEGTANPVTRDISTDRSIAATPAPTEAPRHAGASPAITDITPTDRAERIERLQESLRAGPLRSLTLRIEDAAGAEHRIRVDLRGGAISADIRLADLVGAETLVARLPELRQRLGERGYEPAALQVRAFAEPGVVPSSSRPQPGPDQQSQQQSQQQRQQQQHDQSPHHPRSRHRLHREHQGETR